MGRQGGFAREQTVDYMHISCFGYLEGSMGI